MSILLDEKLEELERVESDVMVDLETLGVAPGSVILSIGAVRFWPGGIYDEFYAIINTASCQEHGLTVDAQTMQWWGNQSDEAREVLAHAEEGGLTLREALERFSGFFNAVENSRIWGNGADFDNALLAAAYRAAGLDIPWRPWDSRCYRTLKSILPGPRIERRGTHHNALDDARSQALHAIVLLKENKLW